MRRLTGVIYNDRIHQVRFSMPSPRYFRAVSPVPLTTEQLNQIQDDCGWAPQLYDHYGRQMWGKKKMGMYIYRWRCFKGGA